MTTPLPGHLGRLPAAVQEAMRVSVEAGALGPADLDPSVVGKLKALPEAAALICVKRFLAADLSDVANKTGFLVGIIGRLRRETPAALAGGPAPVAIAAGHGDFNKTLWVGNLPSDVRVEQLRAVFGCVGIIRDLRLAQNGNIAFVEYEKAEDAAAARQLDGARLGAARRYVAAIACLKRALYLDPFEWIISYNLGLVHLNTGQYASAFHYFSTSINLKPDFPSSYMYLGITLNRLDDFENACAAYEKAIDMEEDHLFELNYAITLFNNDEVDKARAHYAEFEKLWARLDEDTKNADQEVVEQQQALGEALRPAS